MTKEMYDLHKAVQPSIQDELRDLRASVDTVAAALEELSIIIIGMVSR